MEVFVVLSFRWLNLRGFSSTSLRAFLSLAWRRQNYDKIYLLCGIRSACKSNYGVLSISGTWRGKK
ncbi:MAG: hypothetical protein GDA51_12910, partial [Ekhidna sp.]|nr:hypothetical protein [Ekhidna sp.]